MYYIMTIYKDYFDESVAENIAGQLGKSVYDEVDQTALNLITSLNMENSGKVITTLKGIVDLTNLTNLNLSNNQVQLFAPLFQ